MKSIKAFILLISIIALSCTNSKSEAVFSVTDSSVRLNGSSTNNFKGHVALDEEKRGIIITANDGAQNETLLRLVSEKLETDSYLIDYRLMRSCDFETKIKGENLLLKFSPQSLENRNKNDKFDVSVEIFNYKNFIPENINSDDTIKEYLKSQCSGRKDFIAKLKSNFQNVVSDYHKKYDEYNKLNSKVISQSQELENIKTAIQDAESQIKDITYLKDSYQMQLKSISSLTTGANKLINKEGEKSVEIESKEKELEQNIKDSVSQIKTKEESLGKLKELYHSVVEQSKDIENKIISAQRDLSEVDNNLSNIKSDKLSVEYDLKSVNNQKEQLDKSISEISEQISKSKIKSKENNEKIDKSYNDKNEIERIISSEKEEIKSIEEQINQLFLKKSKKEENLKNKFDQLKIKDEEIANSKIENDQILANIKRLSGKKEKLEVNDKNDIDNKINNLNEKYARIKGTENEIVSKQKTISTRLEETSKVKDNLQSKINDNNKDIEKVSKEISELNNARVNFEKRKNDLANERKDKELKLKNLRNEAKNYDGEKENVKRSLNIANDNYETFKGILNDFTSKIKPVETTYNTLVDQKNSIESEMKDQKKKIRSIANNLRKETPSAVIMIDLAEDDALNEALDKETKNPKWRILVDKIIH